MTPLEIFWVVMCKDGPLYPVAGPFCNAEAAEEACATLGEPYGRCYLTVMKSTVVMEEV